MRICSTTLAALAATLTTAAVWGHPGHGSTDAQQVEHYLAEPVHAAPLVVALAIVAFLVGAGLWLRSRATIGLK